MKNPRQKRRFSANQVVVFRFSEHKLVGKVVLVRPVGKKFLYDVLGENGTLYSELTVDSDYNHCIDTYLTKLFYNKYNLDSAQIPKIQSATIPANVTSHLSETEDVEDDLQKIVVDLDYFDEEQDPNY